MSADWTQLVPEWDEFVRAFRLDAAVKIAGSAAMISIASAEDDIDVKLCTELGFAIMLDKPIIIVQLPGRPVPERLRRVADRVVECDIDTGAGQAELAAALKDVVPDLERRS